MNTAILIINGNAFRLNDYAIECAAVLISGAPEDNWGEATYWGESPVTESQVRSALELVQYAT